MTLAHTELVTLFFLLLVTGILKQNLHPICMCAPGMLEKRQVLQVTLEPRRLYEVSEFASTQAARLQQARGTFY